MSLVVRPSMLPSPVGCSHTHWHRQDYTLALHVQAFIRGGAESGSDIVNPERTPRTFYIAADTQQERDDWARYIQQAIRAIRRQDALDRLKEGLRVAGATALDVQMGIDVGELLDALFA